MWKCSNYKLTHNEYGYSNSKRLNTAHVIFCDCAVYITLFSSSSPYVLEGVVLGSLMYCWGWRVIVIFDGGLLRDSLERFIGCSLKGSYQCNACNYACQTWICDFSPILTKSRQKQIQNRNINLNQIFSVFHLKLSKNKQHWERINPYLWHLTNYQVHSKLSKKMGEMF